MKTIALVIRGKVSGGVVSTICLLDVTDEQAVLFDAFWRTPNRDMKTFSLVGDNCSTAASNAFRKAGILKNGIPALDAPNNLFNQLKTKFGTRFACKSGHVGFEKNRESLQGGY